MARGEDVGLRSEKPVEHPGGSLEGHDHSGGALEGHDFSGADLAGRDFSGANLKGAQFVGADLRGALLFNVDAEGAEFAGADLSGAVLREGSFVRAGFGSAKLSGVEGIDAHFEGASFANADVRGANLVGARAEGTNWREAKLVDADLRRANLSLADFTAVELGGARFDDAELSSAKLSRVKGFRQASWIGVDAASLDRRGACFLHDFIEDQNFLAEYRGQGRSYEWSYRIWWLTSDCGRSVGRWAACSAALALVFALLYTQVDVDYGSYETWLSPLYFSVVTLTTLGYGDVLPASVMAQVVVLLEVVMGYVMLGGLISLISNKLSRRAS
jgi:uncharacterized protein YjbI with pentapeptide repeats